jgi:hypothetical protein
VDQSVEAGVGQRDRWDEDNQDRRLSCEINLVGCGQCNTRIDACILVRVTLDAALFGPDVRVQTALQLLKSHTAMAVSVSTC